MSRSIVDETASANACARAVDPRGELLLADLLLSTGLVAPDADRVRLEAALRRIVREARDRYPTVVLPPETFVVHLARHLPRTEPVRDALGSVDAAALYLCCACALGDAVAVAELEREHFGKARAALRRIHGASTLAEDVQQRLREMLFLPGRLGSAPAITKYGGRGDLASWLRTVAMRSALELVAPSREVPSTDETIAKAAGTAIDPELDAIRRECGAAFKRAIEGALRSLPEESRGLLKRYYFEGVTVEELGRTDGIAVSSVSRRLAKARRLLSKKTRELLGNDSAGRAGELDSMLRVVRTQLEITRSALATADSTGRAETTPGRTRGKRAR
jgi:RNA polymerase sigma-70 factor (ECF subfamily)